MVSTRETPERLSIRKAAKVVKRGHTFIKWLVDSGQVRAWNWGGSAKHPRLVVDMAELWKAVDQVCLHIPNGKTRAEIIQKRRPAPNLNRIDPAMRDL